MGMRYSLDHENRMVRVRAWGVVTTQDAQDYMSRLMADSGFQSDYRCLHDMREVTSVTVEPSGLVEAARTPVFHPGARRAVVAPVDAV